MNYMSIKKIILEKISIHETQIKTDSGKFGTFSYNREVYTITKLYLKFPSEHTISGTHYPAEL